MKLSRKTDAFTLVEVMIVVSIVGVLAAVAVPNFIKSRELSHRKLCVANLKQMEGAIQSWAVITRKGNAYDIGPDTAEIFSPTGYIKGSVSCPAGGSYGFGRVGDIRHVWCSLSDVNPEYHTLW